MKNRNNLLLGGDLLDKTSASDAPAEVSGAVDSLGIKYSGSNLEGMVNRMDSLLRFSTRANPLDPFNVEGKTWGTEEEE